MQYKMKRNPNFICLVISLLFVLLALLINLAAWKQREFMRNNLERLHRSNSSTYQFALSPSIKMNGRFVDNESIIATTLTYNTSMLVNCKESPFVDCLRSSQENKGDNQVNSIANTKHTRVAYVRYDAWAFTAETFNFSHCEYSNCIAETEVTNQSDVVAIFAGSMPSSYKIKNVSVRWPHQIYVLMGWESPYLFYGFMEDESSEWVKSFNLSMTYRVDSDIFTPYSRLAFKPQPLNERPNYREIARNKTRSMMWLSGHCLVESKRYEYIKEMKKYIDVDVRGACGKYCDEEPPCMESLTPTYKFYLSFENSLCQDYVTEKFFKLFRKGTHVVPVVRGKVDYEKYFPENTFINAANFRTAKDLALFMLKLGSDIESYSKYLEHMDLYRETDDYFKSAGCTLCKALNTKKIEPKVYNVREWFVGGSQCDQDPKDIY